MIKFEKHIIEGLNIPFIQEPFEKLVKKYNPSKRNTSSYFYEWEFPIEAKDDLDKTEYNWYKIERVTNKEHPDYGKRYISLDMYHGKDSGLYHLIRESNRKFYTGDKVKLNSDCMICEIQSVKQHINSSFTILNITEDRKITINTKDNGGMLIDVSPSDIVKIRNSNYINECFSKLSVISKNLKL